MNSCEEQSPFKAQSPISVTAPIIRVPLAMLQTRHLGWKWKTEQLQWRCGKEQRPKERPFSAQYLQLSCCPFLILLMNRESTGARNTCYRNPQNYCSNWAEMEETPKGMNLFGGRSPSEQHLPTHFSTPLCFREGKEGQRGSMRTADLGTAAVILWNFSTSMSM